MKKTFKLLSALFISGIFIIIIPGYYPQIADMKNILLLTQKVIESL